MTVVRGKITGPTRAGAPARVTIAAYGSTDPSQPVYDPDNNGEIVTAVSPPVASDGTWSADLPPNARLVPAQNVWVAHYQQAGQPAVKLTFIVPTTTPVAGYYWVGDILADPPVGLPATALDVALATKADVTYVDAADAALASELATETADRLTGDASTLASAATAAHVYADAHDATTLASAEAYSDAQDAANLALAQAYADAHAAGLRPIGAAAAATVANRALSGLTAVDGHTPVDGERILLLGQTTSSQNGPWLAHSGAWTRPADFAHGSDGKGAYVFVQGGSTLAGTAWTLSSSAAVVVDTDAQAWTLFFSAAAYTGGTGITITGQTVAADFGTGPGKVTEGNDGRLSDQRTPVDASVTAAKVAAANIDGTTGTPSMRTLGTGAQQAAPGAGLATLDLESQTPIVDGGNATGAVVFPAWGTARQMLVTYQLTGNVTGITLPSPPDDGQVHVLWVTFKQDATGGRTIVTPNVVVVDGLGLYVSTDAYSTTLLKFTYVGAGLWFGKVDQPNLLKHPTFKKGATVRLNDLSAIATHAAFPANRQHMLVNWGDWETAKDVFSGSKTISGVTHTVDDWIRLSCNDAHTHAYTLGIRVLKGANGPAWLLNQTAAGFGVRQVTLFHPTTPTVVISQAYGPDPQYIARARKVDQHLMAILNEPCDVDASHPRWHHLQFVAADSGSDVGSEMIMQYPNVVVTYTTPATPAVLHGAISRTDESAFQVDGDLTGWPLLTNMLLRVNYDGAVPVYGIDRAVDDFSRTITGGWGYGNFGFAWNVAVGSAGNLSTDGTYGKIAHHASLGEFDGAVIDGKILDAADTLVACQWDVTTTGSGAHGPATIARYDDVTGNKYRIRLRQTTVGLLRLGAQRGVNTYTDVGADLSTGITYTPNTPVMFRTRVWTDPVTGNVRLQAKAWLASGTEPAGWTMDFTDSDPARITAPGLYGIGAFSDISDTSVPTFKIDSVRISDTAGAEFVWGQLTSVSGTTSGQFKPNAGGRGWPGACSGDHAAGARVEWASAGYVTSSIVGKTGQFDPAQVCKAAWDAQDTETNRRAAYQQLWLDDVTQLVNLVAAPMLVGFAVGALWKDNEASAKAVISALVGTVPLEKLCVMVTNWHQNYPTQSGYLWQTLTQAMTAGTQLGLQTQNFTLLGWPSDDNGNGIQDLVEAGEDMFTLISPLSNLWFFEFGVQRLNGTGSTNTARTGTYGAWVDSGTAILQAAYLITDPNSINARLV